MNIKTPLLNNEDTLDNLLDRITDFEEIDSKHYEFNINCLPSLGSQKHVKVSIDEREIKLNLPGYRTIFTGNRTVNYSEQVKEIIEYVMTAVKIASALFTGQILSPECIAASTVKTDAIVKDLSGIDSLIRTYEAYDMPTRNMNVVYKDQIRNPTQNPTVEITTNATLPYLRETPLKIRNFLGCTEH